MHNFNKKQRLSFSKLISDLGISIDAISVRSGIIDFERKLLDEEYDFKDDEKISLIRSLVEFGEEYNKNVFTIFSDDIIENKQKIFIK